MGFTFKNDPRFEGVDYAWGSTGLLSAVSGDHVNEVAMGVMRDVIAEWNVIVPRSATMAPAPPPSSYDGEIAQGGTYGVKVYWVDFKGSKAKAQMRFDLRFETMTRYFFERVNEAIDEILKVPGFAPRRRNTRTGYK